MEIEELLCFYLSKRQENWKYTYDVSDVRGLTKFIWRLLWLEEPEITQKERRKEEKNGKKGPFRKKPPSHFVGLHNDKINFLILFKFFRISWLLG